MACCKAEKYKWCKELDTVYTDEEGKDYCVFHAQKGHKGVSVEEFNNLVFQRIEKAKNPGKKCNLSGTIFEGPIEFNQFDEKNSLPEIDFSFTTLTENADFLGAEFSKDAYFSFAKFRGRAVFSSAKFRKWADFMASEFKGEAVFSSAEFSGEADFVKTEFMGRADCKDAKFSGKTVFNKTIFKAEARFENCLIDGALRFEETDLSRVSFLETNLRNFNFVRCIWPRKKGRDVLYDEIQIKSPKDIKAFEQVENIYRQLKQKYKKELNEPEVSNWHYGEKEMFRKKSLWRRFNPISFSNMYWAFSGYGECPVRAGIMLLLLLIFIMTGMNYFGLVPFVEGNPVYEVTEIKGLSGSIDWKKLWLLFYNTIQHILFFKTPFFKPETLSGNIFLTVFTRFIIPIQAALFAFALRNKFRR
jgi:uncharacterized protein YjbI with pentapeptide repeats